MKERLPQSILRPRFASVQYLSASAQKAPASTEKFRYYYLCFVVVLKNGPVIVTQKTTEMKRIIIPVTIFSLSRSASSFTHAHTHICYSRIVILLYVVHTNPQTRRGSLI